MSLVLAECHRRSIFFNISSSSNNNNSVSDSSISIINIYTRLCINSRWVVGICRMATRVLYRSLPGPSLGEDSNLSHSLRIVVLGPEVAKMSSIAAGRREKAAILIIIVVAAAVAVEAAAAAAAAAVAVAVDLAAAIPEHSPLGKMRCRLDMHTPCTSS